MKPRAGFSMVELILVVGVLVLLVSLGSFLSGAYLRAQNLRAAAETVAAELRRARTGALTQEDDLAHGVKVFDDSVVRYAGSSYAWRIVSDDVETPFSSSVVVAGTDEINVPAGSAGPSATTTITLEGNGHAVDITLTPYGVLTVTERTIDP